MFAAADPLKTITYYKNDENKIVKNCEESRFVYSLNAKIPPVEQNIV